MALTQIKSAQIESITASQISDVTATAAELNILDGVTATTAELNILDGVTATAAELSILSGVTANATELNILDGVTATTAELNILDGVTATTAELNYVDGVTSSVQTQLDAKLNLSGGTMSGAIAMGTSKITGLGEPTANQDAATKNYVDSIAQGLYWKDPVKVAANSNVALASHGNIDGTSISSGDRVLLFGQTDSSENGIYVSDGTDLNRSDDMDAASEFPSAAVFVREGTFADAGFTCTDNSIATLETSSITFTQFTGVGQITAGAGLTKSGSTISADLETNAGLELVGSGDTAKLGVKVDSSGGVVQINASGQVVALPYINANIEGSDGSDQTITGTSGTINTRRFADADFTGANNGSGTSVSTTGGFVQVFLNGILLSGIMVNSSGPSQAEADLLGSGVDYLIVPPDYAGSGTAADTVIHFLRTDIDTSDSITIIGFE